MTATGIAAVAVRRGRRSPAADSRFDSPERPHRSTEHGRRTTDSDTQASGRADSDAEARASPSTRATTSCSKRRPARGRRRCSSPATSTCSRRASIRPTSWRSRSRARRRPRCASASSRELRRAAGASELDRARWLELRDRLGDIAISTIDAFCLSLLREFPLEADSIPPSSSPTRPRCRGSSTTRSIGRCGSWWRSRSDDRDVALVLAQLGIGAHPRGLATLLDRRLVAWDALDRFLARGPRRAEALQSLPRCRRGAPGRAADDPGRARRIPAGRAARSTRATRSSSATSSRLEELDDEPEAVIRSVLERVSGHFLTNEGKARKGSSIYPYNQEHYPTPRCDEAPSRCGRSAAAPRVEHVMFAFNRDLNVVLARGVRRMFAVALDQYRRALEERRSSTFPTCSQKALQLLRQMDEFSQSRYPPRVALSPRSRRRVPGHEPGTVGARLAAGPGLGRRARARGAIRRSSSSAIASSRSTVSATPTSPCCSKPPSTSRGCGRKAGRAGRSRAVSAPCPACCISSTTSSRRCRSPAPGRAASPTKSAIGFRSSPVGAARRRSRPILGVAVAETPDECAAAVADEIAKVLDGS